MVKLSWINENRIDHKGQSLVEMAISGSLLLLVFGFLVSWGLHYNYQQQVKMEAFRRSLKTASESDLPKDQEIVIVKDVHIPDPSDVFGLGTREAIRGSGNVFWSNNTSGLDYSTKELSSSVTYVFNPDNQYEYGFFPHSAWQQNMNRTYTTAGLVNQSGGVVASNQLILKGVSDPYPGSPSRIYQEEEGWGPKEVMVLMNAAGNCEDTYCPKTILDEVKIPVRGQSDFYPVFLAEGNVGSPPSLIKFLDGEGGEINATLGALQTDNKIIDKHRSLTLTESPTTYGSAEALNDAEAVNHVIMTSSGDDGPTIVFRNQPIPSWTTQK